MVITDSEESGKKLTDFLNTGEHKKVLLPCWHGVGDIVMFNAPLTYLRNKYPNINIVLGLAAGLQEECLVDNYVTLEGNWKDTIKDTDYDLVFSCHMPLEDANNTDLTKAEVCCIKELGITPVCGHLNLKRKPLVGLHFHNTSVAGAANIDEAVAAKVWQEVID